MRVQKTYALIVCYYVVHLQFTFSCRSLLKKKGLSWKKKRKRKVCLFDTQSREREKEEKTLNFNNRDIVVYLLWRLSVTINFVLSS
jgi:hypothetical protein